MKTLNFLSQFFVMLLFLGMSFTMLPQKIHAADATVSNVRIGVNGSRTRVVLESDKPIKYSFFTLPNPNRVVLDLGDIKFRTDITQETIPHNALIKAMRQGTFKPRKVRMVLDAKQGVKASVFTIPSAKTAGSRLVIDIYPSGKAPRSITVSKPKKPKAASTPLRKQAPAPVIRKDVKKDGPTIVVLDPGHGGIDPGAIGKGKTREKDIVLQFAKRLKKKIETIPNTKVYLTRTGDTFVKLSQRVAYAQRRNADLFISLHADAHSNRTVSGGSVYVLSERSSDREAARLARNADKGDIIAGINFKEESSEVRNILLDLTQRETLNKSSLLAQNIIIDLKKAIKVRNKSRPLFAGFRVLKAPEIPSVLVELAYISNPSEERKLRSRRHQEKVAAAITRGVKRFINKHVGK